MKLKAVLKEIAAKKGIKLSYMPIFIKVSCIYVLKFVLCYVCIEFNQIDSSVVFSHPLVFINVLFTTKEIGEIFTNIFVSSF